MSAPFLLTLRRKHTQRVCVMRRTGFRSISQALLENGDVDEETTGALIQAARATDSSCSLTFHRAFDLCSADLIASLETLIRCAVEGEGRGARDEGVTGRCSSVNIRKYQCARYNQDHLWILFPPPPIAVPLGMIVPRKPNSTNKRTTQSPTYRGEYNDL